MCYSFDCLLSYVPAHLLFGSSKYRLRLIVTIMYYLPTQYDPDMSKFALWMSISTENQKIDMCWEK